ncbi:MAG: DUF4118 domain-containing protein [Oscillospiraceae bacterium]
MSFEPGNLKISDSEKQRVLVCISQSPSCKKVVESAACLANAFFADFTAIYVETDSSLDFSDDERKSLAANIKLAEKCQAGISMAYGDDIASQIAEYAKASGVTKLVIGRTNHRRGRMGRQSLVDRVIQLIPDTEIYIIPDDSPPYREKRRRSAQQLHSILKNILISLALLSASTLIGLWFRSLGFSEATIITVYILGVLFSAFWTEGHVFGLLVSIVSVLVFNFLFTEPRFTLQAYGTGYPVTFIVMFAAAFLTSSLTAQARRQAQKHARNAYRTEVLLSANRKLQMAEDEQNILQETALQMQKLLCRSIALYPARGNMLLEPIILTEYNTGKILPSRITDPKERAVAEWAFANNKHAGATTKTFPDACCLYLAVRGRYSVYAVAAVIMDPGDTLDAFDKNLLLAMLGECGLALEKERLDETKRALAVKADQEQLRSNLLRAISHDLRTPLTSISGNANMLLTNSNGIEDDKKMQLYADIYDDSVWLINLVENLLSITRLDDKNLALNKCPELVFDVIEEALTHVRRSCKEHHIVAEMPKSLLLARMDARLIVQVLVNLIDNAAKYTAPGSTITVSALRRGSTIVISVADEGEGIPDESKEKIFDMFYTGKNMRCDGRRGLGLGLALCRTIVSAHNGSIYVTDNVPRGAIFSFTLEAEEAKTDD